MEAELLPVLGLSPVEFDVAKAAREVVSVRGFVVPGVGVAAGDPTAGSAILPHTVSA